MPRPKKNNADYFTHDKDMRNDPKIKALRNEFGLTGYAVWNMLLESLCNAENLVIEYNDLNKTLLSGDFGVSEAETGRIIIFCCKVKLLELDNDILRSPKLNERLEPMFAKRRRMKQKYDKKVVSEAETSRNETKPFISEAETTQSKGKHSKDKVKKSNKELIHSIVDYLNNKLKTKFKPGSEKTEKCINARLNEKYTFDNFKTVINKKYDQWFGTDDAKFLRPETLFGTKFDGYLNELSSDKEPNKEKLTLEKFRESIKWGKENLNGRKYNEADLNVLVRDYPLIFTYESDSKELEMIHKKYLKL